MIIGAGANRDHQHAAPSRHASRAQVLVRHVMPAAAELTTSVAKAAIAALRLRPIAPMAEDADAAARYCPAAVASAGAVCRRPVFAAPHILVRAAAGGASPPASAFIQLYCTRQRGRVRRADCARPTIFRCARPQDRRRHSGAVQNTIAPSFASVHHAPPSGGAAGGDHRATPESVRVNNFIRRLAAAPSARSVPDAAPSSPWGSAIPRTLPRIGLLRSLPGGQNL